jgi:hypothetical protein
VKAESAALRRDFAEFHRWNKSTPAKDLIESIISA